MAIVFKNGVTMRKTIVLIFSLFSLAESASAFPASAPLTIEGGQTLAKTGEALPETRNSNDAAQDAGTQNDKLFQKWMFANLKDPDSAKWERTKDVFYTDVVLKRGLIGKKQWRGRLSCYIMNSKNSFGGYTGYIEYAVLLDDQGVYIVWEGMPRSEMGTGFRSYGQQIIDNYCSKN